MSQKQDRKSGELEVEQDPGLPRARHPRRHLLAAGSRLRDRQAELSEKSDDNYNVTCKSLL